MSRRLALLATVVGACSGHAPPPERSHDDPVRLAPARDDAGVEVVAIDAAPQPPRALDQDLPRLATRAVELLQAVTAALDAAGDDCALATAKLGEVQQTYADVLAANAAIVHANRKRELEAALATQRAALDAAGAALFHAHAMSQCVADPAFAAALDRALGAAP